MNSIDIRKVIADIRDIDVSTAVDDASLSDLGLSSPDIVALVVRVEDLLGFSIPYERLSSVESLGGLEQLVSSLVRGPTEKKKNEGECVNS
ncbi:acyl carrier protein [Nocardiopsis kunsanensis]|uniref:Carrier domain-containing protein n=1 Tax=Nocardiopsis kunsanensis TaxID=141693 RepID=A0A918XK83_9ACTN|nr:acyl carrier protein [Nocardiopsis kunsanensis]GHD35687.1 hypothetical protein GCM10007147_42360 [Nocardiopsis kunsanensis]